MDVKTDNVGFIENTNKDAHPLKEEMTDLDLEVKIEKLDEERYIKTEVFKEEFVVFEDINEKEKPQEIHFDDSNNLVINKNRLIYVIPCIREYAR